EIDLIVRPAKRIGEKHSHDRCRSTDKSRVSIEQHVGDSTAYAAPEIEIEKCARAPDLFDSRTEHPQRQHVEREMPEPAVYEHVRRNSPPRTREPGGIETECAKDIIGAE